MHLQYGMINISIMHSHYYMIAANNLTNFNVSLV